MIYIKTKEEIEKLREGGQILSDILNNVALKVVPGVTVLSLDNYARSLIEKTGGIPAFLGYTPEGISYPYPNALCVSINEEIVHGIPKEGIIIKDGDVVSIDLGLKYKNMFTDMAMTVVVGKVSPRVQELVDSTKEALMRGIDKAVPGNRVGAIGFEIEKYINSKKFGIVRELAGHGVGKYIHEDPYVPNYGSKNSGVVLKPGMVIAIEPMITEGLSGEAEPLDDEYTWVTTDGKKSAHFEKTVLITENGPEILTP